MEMEINKLKIHSEPNKGLGIFVKLYYSLKRTEYYMVLGE